MSRKIVRIILVLVFQGAAVQACSPVYAPIPEPAMDSQGSVLVTGTPEVTESFPTPTLAPVVSPQPADSLPAVPPTPRVASVSEDNRIQFPPGGTWVEVNGFLDEGSSKTYVLAAMQGQVMSISVRQSRPFRISVADATRLLTDPNYERPFWRGALPATQDYFITLNTQASGDYTLRVAINPPGKARQYFNFVDPEHTSTLRYSDEFVPTDYIPAGYYPGGPLLVLEFIRLDFLTPVTNLSEAYFLYSAMDDPASVATCTQPLSSQENILAQKVINGYKFTQSEMVGAGAGNIYHLIIYRTIEKSVCYEMVFFMHSGNIGNYVPGTVVEFNQDALLGKFEEILTSFYVS